MKSRIAVPLLAATLLLTPGCGPDLQKENEALKAETKTVRDENARALRLLAGRADVAPNAISPAPMPKRKR